MKLRNLLLTVCGAALVTGAFTSCHLDPAPPVPAEEKFLREFIKRFGLIDPNQDWNQAKRTSVRVITDKANEINVFVRCADMYYRVACYSDVTGMVEIPADIPEDCSTIYVSVDGEIYVTTLGGTVDATVPAAYAPSRADGTEPISEWKNMAWLLVAEDLGATDDYDFNDIIIRIEAVSANLATVKLENKWWQVIEDGDEHLTLEPGSRGAESRIDKNYTQLRITSMSAGGILDSYLHYRSKGGKDFILGPDAEWDLTDNSTNTGVHEWHTWFAEQYPSEVKNGRHMLNTNLMGAGTKSSVIIVDSDFSMEHYGRVYYDYDGDLDEFDNGNFINDNTQYAQWDYDNSVNCQIVGFYITVGEPTIEECKTVLTPPRKGTAPQIFLIPDAGWGGYWHWPSERVSITSVYPRFAKWVHGTDADWYIDQPTEVVVSGDHIIENPYVNRRSN